MNKGEFIEVEYVGRVSGTDEIFDLTDEKVAKENNIYDPKNRYGPVLVIFGNNMILKGVEKELEAMNVGEEKEFDVKPDEGFGQRNPNLIKIISVTKFYEQKMNPIPGIFVNINGMNGKVQSVSGGRVRVDFNHPLAGRVLNYKIKIVKAITGSLDQARSLLDYYGLKCETKLDNGKLAIKTDKPVDKKIQEFIENAVKKWIPEIKKTEFEIRDENKDEKTEPKQENSEKTTENVEKAH